MNEAAEVDMEAVVFGAAYCVVVLLGVVWFAWHMISRAIDKRRQAKKEKGDG